MLAHLKKMPLASILLLLDFRWIKWAPDFDPIFFPPLIWSLYHYLTRIQCYQAMKLDKMKFSDSFVETPVQKSPFAKVLPPVKMSKMSSLLPSPIPCHWQVHPPHLCQWPKIDFNVRRSSEDGEDGEMMIPYFALLAPDFPGPQLGKVGQMASFKLCNCILLHLPILQLFLLQPLSMWH